MTHKHTHYGLMYQISQLAEVTRTDTAIHNTFYMIIYVHIKTF